MPKNISTRSLGRTVTKQHKIAIAGVGALGAAAVAFSAVPSSAETVTSSAPVSAAQVAYSSERIPDVKGTLTDQLATQSVKLEAIAAQQKTEATQQQAEAAVKNEAAQKAAQQRTAQETASRSSQRLDVKPVAEKTYGNNLDGWIRKSLDIMKSKGIPGSYYGLHRNIMRESSGNPNAINNWDINARNGIPSKGLLQVIPPTFKAYHVPGTSWNIYDPVANITAAANYAAHRYGSIDHVNSAY
ncbi:transglycosylase SLT domain-containing protein [Streptomyces sp. NPDC004752]